MSTTQLSSSLRSAISKMFKRLRKQVHSVENHSISEMETVGYIYKQGPLLPSELASLVKVSTQSMSQILSKMDGLGLIVRTPSKEDRRKMYISLTEQGNLVVEHTRYERDEWLAQAIDTHLTKQEKKTLADAVAILEKLAAIE